jgi:polysaccharide pyruvyl transferase CsaB
MNKIKAVLCGYYGKGNAGDEALLVSLLQMLPPEVEPIVLSGNPQETQKLYNVASCDRTSTFAILQAFKQSEIFIWGGGSLMQDSTSLASPIYYAGLMALAQKQGLKTIAWAQGIGPLNKSFTRWMTKEVLSGCTAISVRDGASAKLLQNWQLSPLIAPDPVWALQSSPVEDLANLPAPKIAVILRPHPQLTKQRLRNITIALQQFQQATQAFIVLVPFQSDRDMAIAETLAEQLPKTSKIISLQNPRQLKGLFQDVEMVIGMRLHGLIMAAAEACKCFALSYDPKVSQLMLELNLPGWELDRLPETAEAISTAWSDYYTNGVALNTIQIQSLIDRALLHKEMLQQIILNS